MVGVGSAAVTRLEDVVGGGAWVIKAVGNQAVSELVLMLVLTDIVGMTSGVRLVAFPN
jgi:hypothetical protein